MLYLPGTCIIGEEKKKDVRTIAKAVLRRNLKQYHWPPKSLRRTWKGGTSLDREDLGREIFERCSAQKGRVEVKRGRRRTISFFSDKLSYNAFRTGEQGGKSSRKKE